MFIAETKVRGQWEQLANVSFSANETYMIVNNSNDTIYAVEGGIVPSDSITGCPILPTNFIKYEKGSQDLYFRNNKSDGYSKVLVNKVDSGSNN